MDRGQLRKLAEPTTLANGKRIPGLKLDHPRGNWRSCMRWCDSPTSPPALPSRHPRCMCPRWTLSVRMDPDIRWRRSLRSFQTARQATGGKIPRSRRYRLIGKGYSVCVIFLKLFERVYAPLTAGLLKPFAGRSQAHPRKALRTRPALSVHRRRSEGSSACCRIEDGRLMKPNENKILVARRITA